MKNSDLYTLIYCDEDIRTSLDELSEGGKLSEKGELRLQAACAVAAGLIRHQVARFDGAFEPKDGSTFRQLSGRVLAHEAGHLLVAIEKALKAETEQRETPSWGGAAATDMAINANLKAPPEPVPADSPLNCPRMGVYKARVLSGGAGGVYDRIHEFECTSQAEADAEAARLASETMVQWDGAIDEEPLLLSEFAVEWGKELDDLEGFKALRPDQTPVVYVSFVGKGRNRRIVWRTSKRDADWQPGDFKPSESFCHDLRNIAASVSGPLVPAELAIPAFRDAVYALAMQLPLFVLPGYFSQVASETELRHVGHLVVVYAAMCLREFGDKEDRQVAAVCESIASKRFPKLP